MRMQMHLLYMHTACRILLCLLDVFRGALHGNVHGWGGINVDGGCGVALHPARDSTR